MGKILVLGKKRANDAHQMGPINTPRDTVVGLCGVQRVRTQDRFGGICFNMCSQCGQSVHQQAACIRGREIPAPRGLSGDDSNSSRNQNQTWWLKNNAGVHTAFVPVICSQRPKSGRCFLTSQPSDESCHLEPSRCEGSAPPRSARSSSPA